MRKLVYVIVAFMLMSVTSCKEKGVDKSAIVGNIAREYYSCLLKGDYDAFVEGMDTPDRIPDSYRRQLVDNAKMFMAQMEDEHGGIDSVKVRRAVLDTLGTSASVFLMLYYGDSLAEQIVVPMVERDSVWKMR